MPPPAAESEKPRRSLSRRHAFVRRLQDPRPKIPAQCSSHHPPPSRWMLNHRKSQSSHHNRFIDRRTCSSVENSSSELVQFSGIRASAILSSQTWQRDSNETASGNPGRFNNLVQRRVDQSWHAILATSAFATDPAHQQPCRPAPWQGSRWPVAVIT